MRTSWLIAAVVLACLMSAGRTGADNLDGAGGDVSGVDYSASGRMHQDNSTAGDTAGPAAPSNGDPAWSRFDFREVITRAKDKVFPAVVFIKCIQETHEQGKKLSREVSGSGVVISATGELLTNWHVVDKTIEVRCLLLDGRALYADVVGTDKDTDLALLQLRMPRSPEPLPHAVLGDSSKLREGDFVMAMGAPWGLNRSVSIGIVSCTRRYLPEHSKYSLWLQTDAAISPGNSGGPLVNTDGEVVGINTRGVLIGGDTGFSVPSATVARVVRQLREHGRVNWSWTGLQLQPLRDFTRNIYFQADEGVIVAATDPESPARRAGILPKDRMLAVNATPLTALTEEDLPAVRRTLGMLPEGKAAVIELMRGDSPITVELVPREKGKIEGEERDFPRWDFTAKAINQFDNPNLYFHRKEGVFVYGIKRPGNAAGSDLRRRDIILKIDGQGVTTLDDLEVIHEGALRNVRTKHRAVVTVLRDGLMRQIVLDFSRDFERQ